MKHSKGLHFLKASSSLICGNKSLIQIDTTGKNFVKMS